MKEINPHRQNSSWSWKQQNAWKLTPWFCCWSGTEVDFFPVLGSWISQTLWHLGSRSPFLQGHSSVSILRSDLKHWCYLSFSTSDIHLSTSDIHLFTSDIHLSTSDIHLFTSDIHLSCVMRKCSIRKCRFYDDLHSSHLLRKQQFKKIWFEFNFSRNIFRT